MPEQSHIHLAPASNVSEGANKKGGSKRSAKLFFDPPSCQLRNQVHCQEIDLEGGPTSPARPQWIQSGWLPTPWLCR